MRIQPSLKKTFKSCGVITLGYFAQCYATSIPSPPPPPTPQFRFHCIGLRPKNLLCFFIRMPKDPSPTLHRFSYNFLARWTSFIYSAGNTLLKSVKLPSLRAICQPKTNLDNLDLQSHKILQMLLSLWKWGREFVPPPPTPHYQQKTSLLCRIISPRRIRCITFK